MRLNYFKIIIFLFVVSVIGQSRALAVTDIEISDGGSVIEGAAFSFTVSLSASDTDTITVDYNSTKNSTTDSEDFTNQITGTVTFAPGEVSQIIAITTIADGLIEDQETLELELSNPSENAQLGETYINSGTLDDAIPDINISDFGDFLEGTILKVPLSLTLGVGATVTVEYSGEGSTADSSDFVNPITGTVSFAPWETVHTINIQIIDDHSFEGIEDIAFQISNPSDNANLGEVTTGNGNIVDQPLYLSISPAGTHPEGTSFIFPLSLSASSDATITVDYYQSGGDADSSDFSNALTGTVTFDPGVISKDIIFDIVDDGLEEDPETLTISITNVSGASATIVNATASGLIDDSDIPLGISLHPGDGAETLGIANVPITLYPPRSITVTVDWATTDDVAISPSDYISASGTVTFAPGESEKMIDIVVVDTPDDIELPETFNVSLSNPVGASLASSTASVAIFETAITISDITVDESVGNAEFAVTFSRAINTTATITLATVDGTAIEGVDYITSSISLEWAPGVSETKTFSVPILDDDLSEPSKVFNVLFVDDNQQSALRTDHLDKGVRLAQATITDSDTGTVEINIDEVNIYRTKAPGPLGFHVSLSMPALTTVTIDYVTNNGTALAGSDYVSSSGSVSFAPGETLKQIPITIIDDGVNDGMEYFSVNISNPIGASATIVNAIGKGDIKDPSIFNISSITPSSPVEGDTVTVRVELQDPDSGLPQAPGFDISVNYQLTDDSAVVASDLSGTSTATLNFAPTDTYVEFNINILDDSLIEGEEIFNIILSSPVPSEFVTGIAKQITIKDNDFSTSVVRSVPASIYVSTIGSDTNDGLSIGSAVASLSSALSLAIPGDVIRLAPGVYTSEKPLILTCGNITIMGADPKLGAATVIDLAGFTSTYIADSDTTTLKALNITNISFINGNNVRGLGAVFNFSHGTELNINNCVFKHNYALQGGAIAVMGYDSILNLEGSVFDDNTATDANNNLGGALYLQTTNQKHKIVNTIFKNNSASHGGAIYSSDSVAEINGCKFFKNMATVDGGAIALSAHVDTFEVNASIFIKNNADHSGGAVASKASAKFINCNFVANTAAVDGGAIYFADEGDCDVRNSILYDNAANRLANDLSINSSLTVVPVINVINNILSVGLGVKFVDSSNSVIDPLFKELDTVNNIYDLRLQDTSTAIGMADAYHSLRSFNGALRVSPADIGAYESNLPVVEFDIPVGSAPEDYVMISPVEVQGAGSLLNQLESQLGPYGDLTAYRLFQWDPLTQQYLEGPAIPGMTNNEAMGAQALWLISREPIKLHFTGEAPNGYTSVVKTLSSGWNMLGIPFTDGNMKAGDIIKVQNSHGVYVSFDSTQANPDKNGEYNDTIANDALYSWDENIKQYVDIKFENLKPGQGIWLYNVTSKDVVVLFSTGD